LRDLSSELDGSGSVKMQADEAARLPNSVVNDSGRATRATVRGGFPFSVFAICKYRRKTKDAKTCFQFRLLRNSVDRPKINEKMPS
jgi:hypothetical protein